MGAAADAAQAMRRPGVPRGVRGVRPQSSGGLDPKDRALLDTRLLPDPDKVRMRVYETNSVHKSMSALRQGSIDRWCATRTSTTVEAPFKEAFFTHTSTSPNLQIIASLDVARRQMELEGYELVQRAIELAIEHPARDQRAPADLEVFPRARRRPR